jgi:Zn finger protein HypA/HybF involved in hydrogenase expression
MVECSGRAQGRAVVEVWARCSASIDADELAEGFAFLAAQVDGLGRDGCLRQAQLKVEPVPVYFKCNCGFAGVLRSDNFAGHLGVCPRCDQVGELAAGVELVAIIYADTEPPLAHS